MSCPKPKSQSLKNATRVLIFLIILSIFISSNAFAKSNSESSKFTLEVKNKIINLSAENANFKEILKELEGKTGIKFKIFEGVKDKKVSLSVKSLPIYAISTILEKMALKNFAVVYDQQFASIAAYILPGGKDISNVIKGKPFIGRSNFKDIKNIDHIKGRGVASITKGKNKIPIRYVEDEIILKFHLGVSKKEIYQLLNKYNLEISENALSKIGCVKARIPDGRDVLSVIKEVRKEHKVKVPEPNYILNTLTVMDPLYNYQWYVSDINFDKVWDNEKSENKIKVAVIDSGVDAEHPDLSGKILDGYDFVNNDNNPSDDHGHGTFVSGIIAASANNIGIRGLYDQAQIIPVKVIDKNGFGTYEDVALGVLFAADNGAKIINLSIGGYGYSFVLQDAIDYALEKGCIVVAAGGNDMVEQEMYPAAYPDVVGVSALEYDGRIWSESNTGRHIDVSAPGMDIISTGLGESYVYASGTSASASMVSALTAMLASEKPYLSSAKIRGLVIQTSKDWGEKGWDNIYGNGEIDAQTALAQDVKPFHDVAVRRVSVEPMVFEKVKPIHIVANINNAGTYNSEKCDVILYKIIGEEKNEIEKKQSVAIIDKKKIVFNWKPEKIERNIRFEVNLILKDDANVSNNSKTSSIFSLKEIDSLYVLYKVEPPVHQWIAFQAYNKLPSGELKNEINDYLPIFSSSSYYASDFSPPSSWDTSHNSPSNTYALLEGAWEEDKELRSTYRSYCEHFWNPDDGYDAGYNGLCIGIDRSYDSALEVAQVRTFYNALTYYTVDKNIAYYWLGRTAHLLMDMSVPAHVLNDPHFPLNTDGYEEYTGDHYREITSSSPNTTIPNVDSLPAYSATPVSYNSSLNKLFHSMAQYANDFDSDDYNGKSSTYGYGKFRHARNELDVGKSISKVELWDSTILGNPDYKIRDMTRYVDYDYYSCDNRIYYYEDFYNEINNTDDGVRVFYTDGSEDFFVNLDENIFNDVWDESFECIYQPNLESKAIGYVAALYQLFWNETANDRDDDGDSFTENEGDCNDSSSSIHPGATELCNGVDDDCDGQIDEGVKNTYYRDADGDGYGNSSITTQACSQPAGYVSNSSDCNDSSSSIHPGATEICDGIDNDCNGQIDEVVCFLDMHLEAKIREAIGKPTDPIYNTDLEGLTSLDAGGSNITDLTGLEYCTDLTSLNLSYNNISEINALSGLTNLISLSLNDNNIININALSGLTNLTSLNLSYNDISEINALSSLTNLTQLYMQGNQIINIDALSSLTNLTSLSLYNNHINNIDALSGLTNLTQLFLSTNEIININALSGLTNLTQLYMQSNQIINIDALSGLTNLNELLLGGNQIIEINALSGLTNLYDLDLSANQIINIDALSSLTNLASLNLSNNLISEINALSGLTNLTWLILNDNQIININALSGLTNLTQLYMRSNQIINIDALSGLTNLYWLFLQDNQITNINALSILTNLTWLHLNDNQINNISSLSGLTNLYSIGLSMNEISNIDALSGLPNLTWLELNNNQVVDISALVANTGIDTGDIVYLSLNPLNCNSILKKIPILLARGVNVSWTDNNTDKDNDGILDVDEDKNQDGIVDADETDPCNPDSDFDGMPDGWEVDKNTNPLVDDALVDNDNDGYSNLRECLSNSDPWNDQDIPTLLADFNFTNAVDGSDLAIFIQEYGRDDCSIDDPCGCDLNFNGYMDGIDLFLFSEDYGRIE